MDAKCPFTIRMMRPADYHGVLDLWRACGLPSRPLGRDSEPHIRRELAATHASFLLAEDPQNQLIGTVFATHDGRKGWINRLAVDPRWQSRGVGRALVLAAEEHLRTLGIGIIACLIEGDNDRSEQLFTSLGYVFHDDIRYYTKRKHPGI